jgi:predicted MFS family arabinose efflux permease
MTRPQPSKTDRQNARDSRLVAIVLVGTMALWLGAQWMGGRFGWEARFVFLFDLAALAAFLWTMVVTYRIWRRNKSSSGRN